MASCSNSTLVYLSLQAYYYFNSVSLVRLNLVEATNYSSFAVLDFSSCNF